MLRLGEGALLEIARQLPHRLYDCSYMERETGAWICCTACEDADVTEDEALWLDGLADAEFGDGTWADGPDPEDF